MPDLQLDQPIRPDQQLAAGGPPVPAPVPPSLADETGYLLRCAYVHAGRLAAAAMPDGLPVRHYEALQALADLGPRSQHELSELLSVNRTIMVKLIDALEHDGRVERRRNPADRRSYALQLTTAGKRALTRLSAAADRAESSLTAALNPDERARLRAHLEAIALASAEPPQLPAGLSKRISFLLTAAHTRVRERVNEGFDALGLTTALYGVLTTLDARGPISQQQIAHQLGLTGPAIFQTVDRLEAAGLVDRRRDPTDRRSYALEPTPHGHDTLRQARDAIAQINKQLDHTLRGEPHRRELNQLLRKLLLDN